MHIPLSPDILKRLREEASRRGVEPEQCASQIIQQHFSNGTSVRPKLSAVEMLDQWDREDETDDPTEIARRQQDFEEFKRAINSSHSSHRKIYP